MLTETQLDERLAQWRAEYSGGMPNERSWNLIQTLIDHKGEVPESGGFRPTVTIGTRADEVEEAVRAMESHREKPGTPNVSFRAAMVLRCVYLGPQWRAEEERLKHLERIGLKMSRETFYRALALGRKVLAGLLWRPATTKETA